MLVCIILWYRTSQLWERVLNVGGSHRLESCKRKAYSLNKKSQVDEDDKIISQRSCTKKVCKRGSRCTCRDWVYMYQNKLSCNSECSQAWGLSYLLCKIIRIVLGSFSASQKMCFSDSHSQPGDPHGPWVNCNRQLSCKQSPCLGSGDCNNEDKSCFFPSIYLKMDMDTFTLLVLV